MSGELNKEQQGEQFMVLDPANLPDAPSFPNRPLFALGGLIGGLALGVGLAFLLEIQDTSLRSERDVESVFGCLSSPWCRRSNRLRAEVEKIGA